MRSGVAMDVRVGERVRLLGPDGPVVVWLEWKSGQCIRLRIQASERVVIEKPDRKAPIAMAAA